MVSGLCGVRRLCKYQRFCSSVSTLKIQAVGQCRISARNSPSTFATDRLPPSAALRFERQASHRLAADSFESTFAGRLPFSAQWRAARGFSASPAAGATPARPASVCDALTPGVHHARLPAQLHQATAIRRRRSSRFDAFATSRVGRQAFDFDRQAGRRKRRRRFQRLSSKPRRRPARGAHFFFSGEPASGACLAKTLAAGTPAAADFALSFFGFFGSLWLRNCPLAIIRLLRSSDSRFAVGRRPQNPS